MLPAEPEEHARRPKHRHLQALLAWLLPQHSARARSADGALLLASPRSERRRASSGSADGPEAPRADGGDIGSSGTADEAGPSSPRVRAGRAALRRAVCWPAMCTCSMQAVAPRGSRCHVHAKHWCMVDWLVDPSNLFVVCAQLHS